MTEDKINDQIRALIRTTLELGIDDVRPGNQTGAPTGREDEPFITVLVSTFNHPGQDAITLENGEGDNVTETGRAMNIALASVQFFRAGAQDRARRMKTLSQMSKATQFLNIAGLGLIGSSAVRNLSAVVNGAWEDRAQVDFEFSFVSTEAQTLETFGSFPISIQTQTLASSSEVQEP